jgi:hypothetical protein
MTSPIEVGDSNPSSLINAVPFEFITTVYTIVGFVAFSGNIVASIYK